MKVLILDKADNFISGILFTVSAALSLLLFYDCAGDSVLYRTIFTTLAVAFDSSKVILWLRGIKEHNALFVALALVLVSISLVASAGSALMIVSKNDPVIASSNSELDELLSRLQSSEENVASWQQRVAVVPPEYTTQLRIVSEQLSKAVEERNTIAAEVASKRLSLTSLSVTSTSSTMFSLLGKVLKLEAEVIKLWFLLAVSVLLEVVALATSFHGSRSKKHDLEAMGSLDGTLHFVRNSKSLCGARGPFDEKNAITRACPICMRRR